MPGKRRYGNRVNILKYVKVGEKWRFANVVEKNGKLVRDRVLISGLDEHHPEGTYYIEWYEIGNQRRRKAVLSFAVVLEEARLKAIQMEAMRAGLVETPPAPVSVPSSRLRVETAIDKYLDFIKNHRSPRTYLTYRYTLETLFRQSCTAKYVEDISRDDILQFMTYCYSQGLGHRTVYDKLVVVLQMFKRYDRTKLIQPSDWPNYVEKIRVIYEPEEIQTMLRHADEDEAIFLKFVLGSGFRDREAQHVTWRDVDFHNSVVRVTAKPIWRFKPKNWEERSVPLPTGLIHQLQSLKERCNGTPAQLVFPNSKGKPDTENDMIVKRVAERAQLSCGQCVTKHGNKCSQGPHCQHFFLHKFRHTFATEHLRHGVDIRTLQIWTGTGILNRRWCT
jgi:integrase/recombinase XerD